MIAINLGSGIEEDEYGAVLVAVVVTETALSERGGSGSGNGVLVVGENFEDEYQSPWRDAFTGGMMPVSSCSKARVQAVSLGR